MSYYQERLTVLMYWLCSFDQLLFNKVISGDLDESKWAVTVTDNHANFLYANVAFCDLVGCSREELLSRNAFSILTQDAFARLKGHFDNFIKTESKFRCDILELSYIHKNKSLKKVEEIARSVTINGQHYILSLIYLADQKDKKDQDLTYYLNILEEEFSRLNDENIHLKNELALKHTYGPVIGRSEKFKQTMSIVEKVADTDATVLILGETGTGKELLAHSIHEISRRRKMPLVKVNCAALPPSLMESELFGHTKGAFTDAIQTQIGRFERADKGTIFLDEIGELPMGLQAKLLRVLQEKEINRVGESITRTIDVRMIAATNRDLEKEVKKGNFREDLFYRLNVLPIISPPLRERVADIPLLVRHFLDRYNRKFGKQVEIIPKATLNRLCSYSWPGNIRELEHLIERALILSSGKVLEVDSFKQNEKAPDQLSQVMTLVEIEKEYVVKILEKTGWRVSGEAGAAKILGLNPKTLESKLKRLGIRRPSL